MEESKLEYKLPEQTIEIARNYTKTKDTNERCGIFTVENDVLYQYDITSPFTSKNTDKKNTCYIASPNHFGIRWHTHPNKFYPSIQDLFSLYKNPQKYIEIIFSKQGLWILKKKYNNEHPKQLNQDQFNTFYLYETMLYILSHEDLKRMEQLYNYPKKLKKGGGLVATPLALHFISLHYIRMIKTIFHIDAQFYSINELYKNDFSVSLTIDKRIDLNLLSKNGAQPIKKEYTTTFVIEKSKIKPSFTIKDYGINYGKDSLPIYTNDNDNDDDNDYNNDEDKENTQPDKKQKLKFRSQYRRRSQRTKTRNHF